VPADCVSFGAKGEHGIDGRGSARRQVAGKEGNGEKQQARGYDGGQVVWRKSEEHAGDEASRGKAGGNANRDAEQSQREGFAQNHPTNGSLLRAQRDANSDFTRAARDAIGHQSVKADRSEQESEDGEETGQQSDDALVDKHATYHLVDRGRARGVFMSKRIDLMADGLCQGPRVSLGADIKIAP
jgi:hypothetical protein